MVLFPRLIEVTIGKSDTKQWRNTHEICYIRPLEMGKYLPYLLYNIFTLTSWVVCKNDTCSRKYQVIRFIHDICLNIVCSDPVMVLFVECNMNIMHVSTFFIIVIICPKCICKSPSKNILALLFSSKLTRPLVCWSGWVTWGREPRSVKLG